MAEPALYQHCEDVYSAMEAEAETVILDGVESCMYEGYLTKLIAKLHLPNPYYTYITNALQTMDCIQQLRRGGGSTPSQWLLLQRPTPELYSTKAADTVYAKRNDRFSVLEQQLRDLNRRVAILEGISD